MFVQLGSTRTSTEGPPAKISESDQGSGVSHRITRPSEFLGQVARKANQEILRETSASCSDTSSVPTYSMILLETISSCDVILSVFVDSANAVITTNATLVDFSMERAREKCLRGKYRSVVLHHPSKDQVR